MKKHIYALGLITAFTLAQIHTEDIQKKDYTFYTCKEVKENYKEEMTKNISSMLVTKDLRLKSDAKDKKAIIEAFTKIATALKAENGIFVKKGTTWFFVVGTKDKKEAQEIVDEQLKEDSETGSVDENTAESPVAE